jgi:hypothetical protein
VGCWAPCGAGGSSGVAHSSNECVEQPDPESLNEIQLLGLAAQQVAGNMMGAASYFICTQHCYSRLWCTGRSFDYKLKCTACLYRLILQALNYGRHDFCCMRFHSMRAASFRGCGGQ